VRLLAQVAARFGLVVSEKAAAQAVPVLGRRRGRDQCRLRRALSKSRARAFHRPAAGAPSWREAVRFEYLRLYNSGVAAAYGRSKGMLAQAFSPPVAQPVDEHKTIRRRGFGQIFLSGVGKSLDQSLLKKAGFLEGLVERFQRRSEIFGESAAANGFVLITGWRLGAGKGLSEACLGPAVTPQHPEL